MSKKEMIQEMYLRCRVDANYDTEICLGFLKFLHEEKNELHYLEEDEYLEKLTVVEKEYILQLLNS